MRLLLVLALIILQTPIMNLTSETLSLEGLEYSTVSLEETPKVTITYGGSGSSSITIVVKSGTVVKETKTYNVITTQPTSLDYSFLKFTKIGEKYNLAITLGTKTLNLVASCGVSNSYTYTSSSRNPQLGLTKKVAVNANNVSTTITQSLSYQAFFKTNSKQNRIFNLGAYKIAATNFEESDFGAISLNLSGGLEAGFCTSTTNCNVNLLPVIKDNTLSFKLKEGYCYSRNSDVMGLCSDYSDGYPLKNLILRNDLDPTKTYTMKLTVTVNNGNLARITATLTGISVNRNIYGDCESSIYCVSQESILEDVTYTKEVTYP